MLRVVDRIADLARHMTKVARVALVFLGGAALVDEPHQAYGRECTNDEARKEASSKGLAIEAMLSLDCCWAVGCLRRRC
jgi:hypothetical protein